MTRVAAAGLGVMLAAALWTPAWAQAEKGSVRVAAEPVLRQLEAFRRGDYDTAYTFASQEIQQMFDRPAFERMVKNGYPEIVRSAYAAVGHAELAPTGNAYVTVKIHGANGVSVEALYELVWENGTWKINGVVARPDAGLI